MKNRQKLRKGIILFSFFLFPAVFYCLPVRPFFSDRNTRIYFWKKILLPSFVLDGPIHDCRKENKKSYQVGIITTEGGFWKLQPLSYMYTKLSDESSSGNDGKDP